MIIISDCLNSKLDEGCIKVANTISERIKNTCPETYIISYDRNSSDKQTKPSISDIHFHLNKFFINRKFLSLIHNKKKPILYIPFASNTLASSVRIFVMSLFAGRNINVIFTLKHNMKTLTKVLLTLSRATVIVLSKESYIYFKNICKNKVVYIKTGVDLDRFKPVSVIDKEKLRGKYNIPVNKKVVLHVGHLKKGRNVDKLLSIDKNYCVLLVISSVTESEIDENLRERLIDRGNIIIMDKYIDKIEEIYQLSDLYFFPVKERGNCIDIPLSVLEAAACNLPIITTRYGELKEFNNNYGLAFIEKFDNAYLNCMIKKMVNLKKINNRMMVTEYDWNNAVYVLNNI